MNILTILLKSMAYNPNFLADVTVPIPAIDKNIHPTLVSLISDTTKTVIDFEHHSVILNKDRRLAVVSSCNIDGSTIPTEKILRKGTFKESIDILSTDQLGERFYSKCNGLIDKGHLTKYEDVIWGAGLAEEQYIELGKNTNYYPNAVPQHRHMNRGLWSSLELYILDTEVDKRDLKVCLFTGPILNKKDPIFIHPIDDRKVQIPLHFWKLVIYKKNDKLYALGFMMSHKTQLQNTNLVRQITSRTRDVRDKALYFNDFKYNEPYQVKVEQIEELAGIKLTASQPLLKPFATERPLEILYREIDVRGIADINPYLRTKGFLTTTRFVNIVTG